MPPRRGHNNNQDNVYGAVIMAEPSREFTRFIWWMWKGAKRPPTQDWARQLRLSPPVQAARVYTHHRYLLLLLSPKADTHFTVPRRLESWVVGWLHTEMVYPSIDGHPSWYCLTWRKYVEWGQRVTTKPNLHAASINETQLLEIYCCYFLCAADAR